MKPEPDTADERFQAKAKALELRLLRRRVKNPAASLVSLRDALGNQGFVQVRLSWSGATVIVNARPGTRMRSLLRHCKYTAPDETLYGKFLGAARQLGLRPDLEDIGAQMDGDRVVGGISFVRFTRLEAELSKLRTSGSTDRGHSCKVPAPDCSGALT
jgi:hypothetical protein